MRIFITGGTGFIGRQVVSMLTARGHKLLLLSRKSIKTNPNSTKNISLLKGDLKHISTLYSKIKKFKPDIIIHLAWEGIPDYGWDMSIKNIFYSLNLIILARKINVKKILITGSCWEYGDLIGRIKEDNFQTTPHFSVAPFVFAKRAIRVIGGKIAEDGKMQFLWARLFFVYGPGQKTTSLIPYLISCFKKDIIPKIKNKAGGNDFVYVDDVACALVTLLKESEKQNTVYNIGSGKITSIAKIVNLVAMGYGRGNAMKEPKRPVGFWAGISKAKKEIKWSPQISILGGIKKTVAYYKKNG